MKNNFGFIILPNQNIYTILRATLFLLALFIFVRILFLIQYYQMFESVSASDIAISFLIGLRFDLSSTMMLGGIFFILLQLPGRFKFNFKYKRAVLISFFVIVILALLTSVGDLFYYQFSKRRLSYEIFNILKSVPELGVMILKDYVIELIVFIGFLIFLAYMWLKILLVKQITEYRGKVNDIIYLILTAVLIIISIRGGFQLKPLRESYAFRNDNIILGHLSLNAVFTSIRTLNRGDMAESNFFLMEESIKKVRKMVLDSDEIFLNDEFPLMRQQNVGSSNNKKPNIVIIVMESWPGNLFENKYSKYNPTPNFKNISENGIYFKNFYASGQRTIQGIQAIVGSIPNVAYDDILGSPIEQNRLRPLGVILKELGYQTIFIHGARSGSMGFNAFSKLSGFDKYISKDDFDFPDTKDDGTWGIFDHYVFERANNEFNKMKEPFLGLIMSLTSHAPYPIPSEDFLFYEKSIANYKWLNSLRYSDWSLGKFFDEAKKSDYFENTIFLITSDHAEGTSEKTFDELFRIPCLLYSPKFLEPRIDSVVRSQVDVLPTIIDFMDSDISHSSFGISMLSDIDGFAFLNTGNMFGWRRENWLLIGDREKNIGLYDLKSDPESGNNILNEYQDIAEKLREETLSYIQVGTSLLRENKVYR